MTQKNKRAVTTVTFNKKLDARQTKIRGRILKSTRRLVAKHGYETIGMAEIAKMSGVSRATMYRYFSSRDHVMSEAALAWGSELAASLSKTIKDRKTVGGAVSAALRAIVEESASDPQMMKAVFSYLISTDPVGQSFRRSVQKLFRMLFGFAGTGNKQDKNFGIAMLGRILFTNLVFLATGELDQQTCIDELERSAKVLLKDICNKQVIL